MSPLPALTLCLALTAVTTTAGPFDSFGKLGDRHAFGTKGRPVGQPATTTRAPASRGTYYVPRTSAATVRTSAYTRLGGPAFTVTARPANLRRHGAGWLGTQAGLRVHLTDRAKHHYDSARRSGTAPVFRGTVRRDGTGRPALYLTR